MATEQSKAIREYLGYPDTSALDALNERTCPLGHESKQSFYMWAGPLRICGECGISFIPKNRLPHLGEIVRY